MKCTYIVILCIHDIALYTPAVLLRCIAPVQVVVQGIHRYTWSHAIRVMEYDMYGTSVYAYFYHVVNTTTTK